MFEFSVSTKVVFGEGVIERIGEITKKYGSRVFLVSDAQVGQETGYLGRIKKLIEEETYGVLLYNQVYSTSQTSSNSDIVNRGADQARHAKCDVIVGFGGTTTLEIAKAISFIVSNGGKLEEYFLGRKATKKNIAYIEVPTSYGFVPGLTNSFYVLDKFDLIKKSVETPYNYADLVLFDPRLTIFVSGKVSAYMGIKLLSLAVEALISKSVTVIAEALALKAVELLNANLIKSIQDPENVSFKSPICTSSIITSIAVNNSGFGATYSLTSALNSVYGLYQGLSSSILLPHVLEFNLTSCATKYVNIAKSFGEEVTSITVVEAAIKAIEIIRKLLSELRTPNRLSELNIEKDNFMQVAKIAKGYGFMQNLPRPVSKDDLYNILNTAF